MQSSHTVPFHMTVPGKTMYSAKSLVSALKDQVAKKHDGLQQQRSPNLQLSTGSQTLLWLRNDLQEQLPIGVFTTVNAWYSAKFQMNSNMLDYILQS